MEEDLLSGFDYIRIFKDRYNRISKRTGKSKFTLVEYLEELNKEKDYEK
jgi:hypothetical protein